MEEQSLSSKIAGQSFFALLQQAQKFIFATVGNIIVINSLPRDQYGMLGIVTGYFVLITWLAINPENILMQRYKEIKTEMGVYLSKFFAFNIVKFFFLLIVSLLLGIAVFLPQGRVELILLLVFYTASQLLLLFSGQLQYILKLEFKQRQITMSTTMLKIVELLMLLVLLLVPNVYVYIAIVSITSLVEVYNWVRILRETEDFKFFYSWKETWKTMKENILSYSLWHHFNGNLTKYIYEIDTAFLSLWATDLIVGNYSVAVKIANFTFVVPQIIQNQTTLALTRISDPLKRNRVTNIFIKYAILASVAQLLVFFFLGRFYIDLHTKSFVDEIFSYSLPIIIGTSIINVFRPLISYISASGDMKKFFFYSVLPAAIFSSATYLYSSYTWGAIGLAHANIVNYSFWVITMLVFVHFQTTFRFNLFPLWDQEEAKLARAVRSKFRK